jgi:cytidylate kinase
VVPDAVLKIYLVASEEERARRRLRQDDVVEAADAVPGGGLLERSTDREGGSDAPKAGETPDRESSPAFDTTLAAMRRRDAIDSGRATSPLAVADDAVVLDTTDSSVDAVVAEVLARYRAVVAAVDP